ncbi:universal stress protein [Arthrobacter sp. BB-1]|uniref:universal stress protein n=1 Tax=unclassified Arthrobacter TaxID=235627 RepID=UPI0011118A6E|nr:MULTISPECIES: universal stress protein [unclassified Arthrobacter]TNB69759.1 universal stress protein [Arthrobacter sp. BB-1]
MPTKGWTSGPIVLGVEWKFSPHLIRTAAELATALGQHLVCAFVDPAGYLTEWEPDTSRDAHSLDPATNEEAEYPADELLHRREALLGRPGKQWSFRVLNGDVPKALCRLAENTGASLIIVGADRPGPLARVDRFLAGSVSSFLTHRQQRPVLIVPDQR